MLRLKVVGSDDDKGRKARFRVTDSSDNAVDKVVPEVCSVVGDILIVVEDSRPRVTTGSYGVVYFSDRTTKRSQSADAALIQKSGVSSG